MYHVILLWLKCIYFLVSFMIFFAWWVGFKRSFVRDKYRTRSWNFDLLDGCDKLSATPTLDFKFKINTIIINSSYGFIHYCKNRKFHTMKCIDLNYSSISQSYWYLWESRTHSLLSNYRVFCKSSSKPFLPSPFKNLCRLMLQAILFFARKQCNFLLATLIFRPFSRLWIGRVSFNIKNA